MDQIIRNKLRGVVTQCRKLLEDSVRQELQGKFGIYAAKKDDVQVDEEKRLNLTAEERPARKDILDHFAHIKARGFKSKDALDQLVREIAFTHLNRLCAYKMMEARQVYIGDQKFREAVSRGINSNGVKFYLADHPDDERLFNTGKQDVAYRHFLDWLGGLLSGEIGVLFNPHDSANRLYPTHNVLDQVLELINDETLAETWADDETIGWVYQYFTPKELREAARDPKRGGSQVPRNSYELAFRNQFFTPRYVVEFLTDNTLGRIWYEMRRGKTKLKEQCRYIVRRPNEVFLGDPLAGRRDGASAMSADAIPATVQAAFRGDFANAIREKDGLHRYWIGRVVPPDQYQAATGHPFRENDDHPSVKEVWSTIHEHSDKIASLHPLKILVALSQLVRTASGGPYAARAADELWAALTTAIKAQAEQTDLSQEQLLKQPVCIPFRPKKDPRELRILDPACGSGHFLLYCFDLLLTIYEEAYADPDLGPKLKEEYPTLDALRRDVPRLILAHNLHGIDIDLRCTQIAALALWLRCQRAYREMGLKQDRPTITRSNIVCAEPMPGEQKLLQEFVSQLEPKLLGQLVEVVFDKMELAREAGSLLKIEEEIRDAVAKAKRQWLSGPVSVQLSLFDEVPAAAHQPSFDFSGVTNEQFFEQAESKVVEALRDYAEQAGNGQRLQRRLFADDVVRGFAFVEICSKRFDVVLMNPPFGEPSPATRELARSYCEKNVPNLLTSFVLRCQHFAPHGAVGAITDSTWLKKADYEPLRQALSQKNGLPFALADLGWGVLDEANVAACAFASIFPSFDPTMWAIRLVDDPPDLRGGELRRLLNQTEGQRTTKQSGTPRKVFHRQWVFFARFPHEALAYETPDCLVNAFVRWQPLGTAYATPRRGYTPGETFRFFRCWWEVPANERGKRWWTLNNGSPYSPLLGQGFFVALNEAPDWENHREYAGFRLESEQWFGKSGIGWGKRTDYMYAHPFPAEAMWSHEGPAIFPHKGFFWPILGYLNSMVAQLLINLYCGQHKTAGYVGKLPCPDPKSPRMKAIGQLSQELWTSLQEVVERDETLERFVSVFYPGEGENIESVSEKIQRATAEYDEGIRSINSQALAMLSDFSQDAMSELEEAAGAEPALSSCIPLVAHMQEGILHPAEILQWAVGVCCARWDIRFATGDRQAKGVSDPTSAFAPCPPGMLQGKDGLPATESPKGYPAQVCWDGILVDDSDHPNDVVRRVQRVLELVLKEAADVFETQACQTIGVKTLREYFRKSGKGGFWDDHVTRYTKSRRKAPIYWLLQSSERNYALWVYYHRLDKETLLKALLPKGPVQTKINLEQSRLDDLRKKRKSAEGDNKTMKKLDKEIDRQEDLLNEVKDFAEKLERAAKLEFGDKDKLNSKIQYSPDLNDGVVLNIAPLHELVPWRPAADYWQELLDGEYEWSSMSKLLRKKGLVK
jgi:hypothetical protein